MFNFVDPQVLKQTFYNNTCTQFCTLEIKQKSSSFPSPVYDLDIIVRSSFVDFSSDSLVVLFLFSLLDSNLILLLGIWFLPLQASVFHFLSTLYYLIYSLNFWLFHSFLPFSYTFYLFIFERCLNHPTYYYKLIYFPSIS